MTGDLACGGFIKSDPDRPLAVVATRGDCVISNAALRRAGIEPGQLHTPAKSTEPNRIYVKLPWDSDGDE